jgi:hypothetical protein
MIMPGSYDVCSIVLSCPDSPGEWKQGISNDGLSQEFNLVK